MGSSCFFVAIAFVGMAGLASGVSLERNVGVPSAYDWTAAKAQQTDKALGPIFDVLKKYKLPAATMGYQLNPSPTTIQYSPPSTWRNPQYWFFLGYGMSYKTPMRVASNSKPFVEMVYKQTPALYTSLSKSFYALWIAKVGPLPAPKDPRVKLITIQNLLDHKSGITNTIIGFDPAFQGKSVEQQLPNILQTKMLAWAPGTTDSYSNFGYMILARLAEGIIGQPFIKQIRSKLPANAPIYAASDSVNVKATAVPSAGVAEPTLYYVQSPDKEFDVSVMNGNGNIVTNVVVESWFATQYWIGGPNVGKKFSAVPGSPGTWWYFAGSMPGTLSVTVQYITPKAKPVAMALIFNTRMPNSDLFLDEIGNAVHTFLVSKFASF